MAGKRNRKSQAPLLEDLSKPSRWRLQHDAFTGPTYDADPETGATVIHRRAVDTLGLMLSNNTITIEMHDAGALFRGLFKTAAFDGMATSQFHRLAGGRGDALTDTQMDVRRRLHAALDALGGDDSPAGSCAWFVLGLEFSLRTWSTRQGWAGRHVHGPVAQGVLVAALGTLAMHFGLTVRTRAA